MPDYPHFSHAELQCRCGCGRAPMDPDFMRRLETVRMSYGKPMVVTSAYRCPVHNASVSSTGSTGPHTTGRAIDIQCAGHDAHALLRIALREGMTGVGIRQTGPHSGRFIHLDDLSGANRPWVWGY